MSISQQELDSADLEAVNAISLCGKGITDLSSLRRAPHLEKIVLDEVASTDLGVVRTMAGLKELHLYNNAGLDDLSVLGELSQLRVLEVMFPKRLRLVGRGLRVVGALTGLTSLKLWSPRREKLRWLSRLQNLEELVVWSGRVKAKWISGLGKLTELNLTHTQTSDIAPLSELIQLRDLWLEQNNIEDVRPLRVLTRLTRLLLSHNRIERMRPLCSLENLVRLDINHNGLIKVPSLASLMALQTLDLGHNRLVDIKGIRGLPCLDDLDLRNNRLSHLRGLSELPRLRCLWLSDNRILDLKPLLHLSSLEVIEVDGNRADPSVLTSLPRWYRIDSKFKTPRPTN